MSTIPRVLLLGLFSATLAFSTSSIRAADVQEIPAPSPAPKADKSGPEYLAVMASFPEELTAIEAIMVPDQSQLHSTRINGTEFKAAEVDGRRYLFFLTGMSLVNAAATTQLVIDRFNVSAVFFTGIAGGINPEFHPGDVIIPARWAYHSEAAYFNESTPGKFNLAGFFKQKYKNFGMIFPDDVTTIRDGLKGYEQIASFPTDPALLAAAKEATDTLTDLKTQDRPSKIDYGGMGVSGTVFCDNAEYRKWVFEVWKADCLDMESTAIAQVCWTNKKPCLIVRGLSDLAGGQAGANEEEIYLKAAADHSAQVLVKILQTIKLPVKPTASVDFGKPAPDADGKFEIYVTAENKFVVEKRPVNMDELNARLAQLKSTDAAAKVLVRVDEPTEYKHVVEVLDALRKAKINDVTFVSVKPPTKPF